MTLTATFYAQYQPISAQLELSELDLAFAQFIYQYETGQPFVLAMIAGLVSQAVNQQHSCVHLNDLNPVVLEALGVPDQDRLLATLSTADCVKVVGQENHTAPLLLDQQRLYLQRYYQYEISLAAMIKQRCTTDNLASVATLKPWLDRLFGAPASEPQIDWQRVAVCIAVFRRFALIAGGPGTGKTTTVAKLLVVLDQLFKSQGRVLAVQLVAPTGKAAARLSESLAQAKTRLPLEFRSVLDVQSSTIHRLLGSIKQRTGFRHNRHNQLHLDVLIVDEASMVDLPLMEKLFAALPSHTRIILLGDHNQLSSVETGSVLLDIYSAAMLTPPQPAYTQHTWAMLQQACDLPAGQDDNQGELLSCVQDSVVTLQHSHRFSDQSAIGQLAKAVISADQQRTFELLRSNDSALRWYQNDSVSTLVRLVVKQLRPYFEQVAQGNVGAAFKQLSAQQILCVSRQGIWGVEQINHLVEVEMYQQGVITQPQKNYPGRPIMLSSNDHSLGLYNGDIGIIMPDPQQPELTKAWFSDADGEYRGVLLSRLPAHQTVYAMTIHKSQGSEFEQVYVCLPEPEQRGLQRGLTKELLYTGLTRAKQQVVIFADSGVLRRCLHKQCGRNSGLASRL